MGRKHAGIVFGEAPNMVDASRALRNRHTVIRSTKTISQGTTAWLKALSATGATMTARKIAPQRRRRFFEIGPSLRLPRLTDSPVKIQAKRPERERQQEPNQPRKKRQHIDKRHDAPPEKAEIGFPIYEISAGHPTRTTSNSIAK